MNTFIDLFAGIGGFRLALESEGLKCVFSSEIDKDCASAYSHNFGETPHADIRQIDVVDVPPHDVLCAGFPCQSFSVAAAGTNKRHGLEDVRGNLFYEIIRIASYHKPKLLLLENVPGLLSHDGGHTLQIILKEIKDIGYHVYMSVLNCADFGLAQNRERVYIVGIEQSLNLGWQAPDPTEYDDVFLKDILLPEERPEVKKLRLDRDDIVWEEPRASRQRGKLRRVGYLARYVRRKKTRQISQDGVIFHPDGVAPTSVKSQSANKTIVSVSQQGVIHSDKGVAPTLTGSDHKDKGGRTNVLVKEGGRVFHTSGVYPTLMKSGKSKGIDASISVHLPECSRIYDAIGVSPTLTKSDLFNNRSTIAVEDRRNDAGCLEHSGQNNTIYGVEGVAPVLARGSGNTDSREKIGIEISAGGRIYDTNGVSNTVLASSRSRDHQLVGTNKRYIRKLHVIEKKRIMGFPDNWHVSKGTKGHGQLGNAVVPKMVQLVFRGVGKGPKENSLF